MVYLESATGKMENLTVYPGHLPYLGSRVYLKLLGTRRPQFSILSSLPQSNSVLRKNQLSVTYTTFKVLRIVPYS